jgi:hypothetical protein
MAIYEMRTYTLYVSEMSEAVTLYTLSRKEPAGG